MTYEAILAFNVVELIINVLNIHLLCEDGKLRGRCGTPGYVAPEILKAGWS